MQFLYSMGEEYVFMNNETYEQLEIPVAQLDYEKNFLVEGMEVDEVIKRVEGIHCGMKPTSCPDQLATALKEAKEKL